jgi:hypothetical protein
MDKNRSLEVPPEGTVLHLPRKLRLKEIQRKRECRDFQQILMFSCLFKCIRSRKGRKTFHSGKRGN